MSNDAPDQSEQEINQHWTNPYHPDIDLIAQLEALHQEMEKLVSSIGSDGPSPREQTLGTYRRLSHELSEINKENTEIDEFITYIWTETAKAIWDESRDLEIIERLEEDPEIGVNKIADEIPDTDADELEFEDIGYFLENTIKDIKQDLDETEDQIHITGHNAYDILSYFTAASSVVEYRSSWIIHDEFIDEEFKKKKKTWKLLRGPAGLNQKQREQWLLRTGLINNGLHSKMSDLRNMRNELIHHPYAPNLIWDSVDHISITAQRGLDAAEELTAIVADRRN